MTDERKSTLSDLIEVMLEGLEATKIGASYKIIRNGYKFFCCDNDDEKSNLKNLVKKIAIKLNEHPNASEDNIGFLVSSIKSIIRDNSLLEYYERDKRDELVALIMSGNCNRAETRNRKILSVEFVDLLFENIDEYVGTNKLVIKSIDTILEESEKIMEKIDSSLDATVDKIVHQIEHQTNITIGAIEQRNQENEIQPNIIKDENDKYEAIYETPLFLENEIDDNKQMKLSQIFIMPSCKNEKDKPLKEILIEWSCQPMPNSQEITYSDSSILLVYGNAGVGKSSLVSRIIVKKYFDNSCHCIALKRHVNEIDHDIPWESIKNCFKCEDDDVYKNKILILDGFDELCTLNQNFNGNFFLQGLQNELPPKVKILITSRHYKGYFERIDSSNELKIISICWTNSQINKWCKKISEIHLGRKEWCKNFRSVYNTFLYGDKRREIFCIPIILYICCVYKIDIRSHSSVAEIYDCAFRKISLREHGKKYSPSKLINTEKRKFKILWQYTKELAFQMLLNNVLGASLKQDLVENALYQTKLLCKENEIKNDTSAYFGVFHFASETGTRGVEFAHKTVGEYFTAVKLYEDYFKYFAIARPEDYDKDLDINLIEESFNNNKSAALLQTWKNIYQAFRYNIIPHEVFEYLSELLKKQPHYEKWRKYFFDAYYTGISQQFLWKVINENHSKYYRRITSSIPVQMNITFRNLTWMLSYLDFTNDKLDIEGSTVWDPYIIHNHDILMDLFCINWNLSGIDCCGANLSNSIFTNAKLENSQLQNANLARIHLENAVMNDAHLESANLDQANLNNAKLNNAHLNGAVLSNANLSKIEMKDTELMLSDMSGANVIDGHLERAILYQSNCNETNFTYAHLERAHLEDAYLKDANLQDAHLEYAHLEGANLEGANLKGAHLEGANLEGAILKNASLDGADLQFANLTFADLRNITLYSEDFKGVYLRDAVLKNVFINRCLLELFDEYINTNCMRTFTPIVDEI